MVKPKIIVNITEGEKQAPTEFTTDIKRSVSTTISFVTVCRRGDDATEINEKDEQSMKKAGKRKKKKRRELIKGSIERRNEIINEIGKRDWKKRNGIKMENCFESQAVFNYKLPKVKSTISFSLHHLTKL